MASPLEELPPELLDNIAGFCTDGGHEDSLFDLRATCRTIEGATRHEWKRFHFEERYLDLDDVIQLEKLKQIGAVPELACATTGIIVRCKDDYQQFPSEDGVPYPSGQLMKLSFKLPLVLQNFRKVATLNSRPAEAAFLKRSVSEGESAITFSHTFSFVLMAAQACGLLLRRIDWTPVTVSDVRCDIFLSDAATMPELSECFSNLETFHTNIQVPYPHAYPGFARHFAGGINLMGSLTSLILQFNATIEDDRPAQFFREVVQSVRLPCLARLELAYLKCYVRDLTYFLAKHASTLNQCLFAFIHSVEANPTAALRGLVEKLQDELHLEVLCMMGFEDSDRTRFPLLEIYDTPVSIKEIEDGFVLVDVSEREGIGGTPEIREALTKILSLLDQDGENEPAQP